MTGKIDIIVIRGAPGAGKTQTAKSLAHSFPKGIRLEVDTIRQMAISVDWKNQQEHINMLQASAQLVCEFVKFGYSPVIVVDTFSGDKIEKFIETLQHEREHSIKIFGLYTTDAELKRRLEMRTASEFKEFEVSQKLNSDVMRWKHEKEIQINTTGLRPSDTSETILRHLSQ